MKYPEYLYRYRPLEDALLDREMSALGDSYLFSPQFQAMNDPMEAFYETDIDSIKTGMVRLAIPFADQIKNQIRDKINQMGLISLSTTVDNLPMWAYYGGNFSGMCLEFSVLRVRIGDLSVNAMRPVIYEETPLRPLNFFDISVENLEANLLERLQRKRNEWSHEKEWRFITRISGKKYYVDDALHRVYLGPRAQQSHIDAVCAILKNRKTEVLLGKIVGYNLTFDVIQPACADEDQRRIGAGSIPSHEELYNDGRLMRYLSVKAYDLYLVISKLSACSNVDRVSISFPDGNPSSGIIIEATFKFIGREHLSVQYNVDNYLRPWSLVE